MLSYIFYDNIYDTYIHITLYLSHILHDVYMYICIYTERDYHKQYGNFHYVNTQVQIQTLRHTVGEANLTKYSG